MMPFRSTASREREIGRDGERTLTVGGLGAEPHPDLEWSMPPFTRRLFVLSAASAGAAALSGCVGAGMPVVGNLFDRGDKRGSGTVGRPDYAEIYSANTAEQYPIEAFRY